MCQEELFPLGSRTEVIPEVLFLRVPCLLKAAEGQHRCCPPGQVPLAQVAIGFNGSCGHQRLLCVLLRTVDDYSIPGTT